MPSFTRTLSRPGPAVLARRIVVLLDERAARDLVRAALPGKEFFIAFFSSGQKAYLATRCLRPSLVLLDLALGRGAHEALKLLTTDASTRRLPLVVIGADADRQGVVRGLVESLGATAFVERPLGASRLSAVVAGAIRAAEARARSDEPLLERGRIRLSVARGKVWVTGRIAPVKPKRFELLRALLARAGTVSTAELLSELWPGGEDPNVVAKTVQRLREDLGLEDDCILSSRDGYRLVG